MNCVLEFIPSKSSDKNNIQTNNILLRWSCILNIVPDLGLIERLTISLILKDLVNMILWMHWRKRNIKILAAL